MLLPHAQIGLGTRLLDRLVKSVPDQYGAAVNGAVGYGFA